VSGTNRSIGQVLDLLKDEFSDITISKIRFLESQGLIDPERSRSGYRKFTEADVQRLRWILEQQRDHFLPLKVIKERIDSADVAELIADLADTADIAGESEDAKSPSSAKNVSGGNNQRSQQHNLLQAQTNSGSLTAAEVAEKSGLSFAHIADLERFGLIQCVADGTQSHYSHEAVVVATVAAGFLGHGVEPRHLRAYKSAVEREVGLLEQRIMPLVMQRTPSARQASQDALGELVNLGSELRLALLRMALANHLQGS